MRTFIRITKILLAIIGIAIALFFLRAYTDRRSIPGHIVRWFEGEYGAKQTIDDLADDIRTKSDMTQLQPWAVNTLLRFQMGQVRTNGNEGNYWYGSGIRLAAEERPEFIKKEWGETNDFGEEYPEIYIFDSTNGKPESVGIMWGLDGVVVGDTNYPLHANDWMAWQCVTAKPGIYVFYQYK
jgi:hypothetical protein